MTPDLYELYQQLILDHNRRPRNRRRLDTADRTAEGYNPLCGDRVKVYLRVADDVIQEATFEGSGCAISTASASLMTEHLTGKRIDEVQDVFRRFRALVLEEPAAGNDGMSLGKLAVFAGVRKYPARVKCATLAWHTLKAALEGSEKVISTE